MHNCKCLIFTVLDKCHVFRHSKYCNASYQGLGGIIHLKCSRIGAPLRLQPLLYSEYSPEYPAIQSGSMPACWAAAPGPYLPISGHYLHLTIIVTEKIWFFLKHKEGVFYFPWFWFPVGKFPENNVNFLWWISPPTERHLCSSSVNCVDNLSTTFRISSSSFSENRKWVFMHCHCPAPYAPSPFLHIYFMIRTVCRYI